MWDVANQFQHGHRANMSHTCQLQLFIYVYYSPFRIEIMKIEMVSIGNDVVMNSHRRNALTEVYGSVVTYKNKNGYTTRET
jgi:hypothetical protein